MDCAAFLSHHPIHHGVIRMKWNSRKYTLTLLIILCATVAMFMKIMDGNAYAAVLVAAQGFYHAANAYDSRTDAQFPTPPAS